MPKLFSRNRIVLVTLVLSTLTLLCIVAYQLFFYNCFWWECAPRRSFSVLDLDLPDYYFVSNAKVESLHYIRNDLSVDPVVANVQWEGGTANYSISKFSTNSKASVEYVFQVNTNVFTKPLEYDEKISEILNYKSGAADESNIRCGYILNDFRCLFVARYQEFTITFNSTLESAGMTNKKFLSILEYIDDTMGSLLGERK